MAYDLEKDWDILYMEYSTDGTTWNVLGTGVTPTWYTNNRLPNGTDCQNCIGGQWTGEAAGTHPNGGLNAVMRPYSYDLSAFGSAGTSQSNMIFRFVFLSDEAEVREANRQTQKHKSTNIIVPVIRKSLKNIVVLWIQIQQ